MQIGEIKEAKEIGLKGSRGYGRYMWQACQDCGSERWVRLRKGKPEHRICRHCSGKRHNTGGYKRTDDGYIMVHISPENFFYSMAQNDGYVLEHRLVMAKHLGRCLQSWEKVHHKGIRHIGIENKSDNLIDNLELTTNGSHSLEHSRGYRDGYRRGFLDAQNAKIKELLEQIKLLRWQIKEILEGLRVVR